MKSCIPNRSHFILKSLAVAVLASGILFVDKAIACRDAPPVQAAASITVNGVYPGMSGANLLQRLGTPQTVERHRYRCPVELIDLSYPQLRVTVYASDVPWDAEAIDAISQGVVIAFSIADPNFSTEEGISIGASRNAAIDTYGTPRLEQPFQGGRQLIFARSNYSLTLLIRDDRVAEIQYSY